MEVNCIGPNNLKYFAVATLEIAAIVGFSCLLEASSAFWSPFWPFRSQPFGGHLQLLEPIFAFWKQFFTLGCNFLGTFSPFGSHFGGSNWVWSRFEPFEAKLGFLVLTISKQRTRPFQIRNMHPDKICVRYLDAWAGPLRAGVVLSAELR